MKYFKYLLFSVLFFALLSCEQEQSDALSVAASDTGTSGSLARFTIIGDYLYTIDFTTLKMVDLKNPANPVLANAMTVGQGVETLFSLDGFLLMGTQTGMLIYELADDGTPSFVSAYEHIQSCDPVVANAETAYVTLRAGCGGGPADQLDIISITDMTNPELIISYPLDNPHGLGLDGNLLFICDGFAGLKVFDVTDPLNLQLLTHLDNIFVTDVITLDGLLLVIGPENVYQFSYNSAGQLVKLSEIRIEA